jgi:glycosyltransferase involved in cell wall biosynthesis
VKVLHAIPGLVEASGGPTTALVGLATAQARAGDQVTVVTTLRKGESVASSATLAEHGITLVCVPQGRGWLGSNRELALIIERHVGESDVVHTHGVWESIQHHCSRACQRYHVPHVMRTCGSLDEWSLRVKPLRKFLYRKARLDAMLLKASAIHCTSEGERASTGRLLEGMRFIIEPNGVQLDDFRSRSEGNDFRARLRLSQRPVIGFLGRIHPGKGLEYLIPALARMRRTDVVLVAAGPDSRGFQPVMEELARHHGVSERVIFTGMIRGAEKVEMLSGLDLFVLPSQHENFGIAVVEAMAAGCAVIVSDQVGIQSEVAKAQCGAVVPLDIAALAAAMDRWLADPERCREAGIRGREFALAAYDWNRIADRWKNHYRRLIAAKVA